MQYVTTRKFIHSELCELRLMEHFCENNEQLEGVISIQIFTKEFHHRCFMGL